MSEIEKSGGSSGPLSLLRRRAELMMMGKKGIREVPLSVEQIEEIVNELQLTQIELEMQNDELKISHQVQEAERAKFVELFDRAPVGYFILDHLATIENANTTGASLLKRTKDEIRHVNFKNLICPGSWETFHACLHKMRQEDKRRNCELKLSIKDKEVFCRMEGTAVHIEGSPDLKFYITLIDITESRKAELSYYEASERLKMVLKASSTGILTIDLETHAVYLDDFSYSLLGIESWSFNGKTQGILKCIHAEDREKVNRNLRKAILSNKEIDIEFRTIGTGNQKRVVAVKGHTIQAGERSFFAGLLMDRTRQRKLEQEAENLRLNHQRVIMEATLATQEKERAALSQVLHDSVCQLLYGIKLNMQNMQFSNHYKGPFQNINFMLDQVIKETRNISYELTPSVLRDFGFVAGIKEMAQRLRTKTFIIDTKIATEADLLHPQIQLYLFRIIQELINNCIKHANASQVQVEVSVENDWVTLLVVDNGKGFTKPVDVSLKEGSGIRGIKNRVFLLNGEIAVRSSKNGTRVSIIFQNDLASMDTSLL